MKNITRFLSGLIASCLLTISSAFALGNQPDCDLFQAQIDAQIPALVAALSQAYPNCTYGSIDRYAVTSGQLADRAISAKKCSKRTSKASCNSCYKQAKDSLKNKMDAKLFHGLMSEAASVVEKKRVKTCEVLAD